MSNRYSLNKNKFLLPDESANLRTLLKKFSDSDPRNTILLEVALATGARAQEILNLTRNDLNLYDQSIFIKGLKNSNDREIPIRESLMDRIVKLPMATRVFPISYSRLVQVWDLYRPVPKKFHSLRHTFAIELYQKTKDIRLLMVALGHRNITNTMIYADYAYSQNELRKLMLD